MNAVVDTWSDTTLRARFNRNRFIVLLAGVIMISGFLVSIALSLYNSSGAAQLDLSGPRYVDVRDKVVQDKAMATFPASGAFDKQAFDDFLKAYDERAKAIGQVNGYDPAAVNNDAFNLQPIDQAPAEPIQ